MNWIAILGVSVLAMIMAMLWFGPIFGNLWMKIHGWENLSKKQLKAQEQWMWRLLALEGINTFIMISVLAFFLVQNNSYSPVVIGWLIWIGFLYPSVVSCVIWGGDEKKWQMKKVMILAGFNLAVILISSFILSIFL